MTSLGEELKRERELRDISLRDISDATKISVRILEAIEKNDYKLLPGGVFNRNFIRAYADYIGVDPESAVMKYQEQSIAMPQEELPDFILPPPPTKNETESLSHKKWIGAAVVVALAALLVVYILFVSHS